MRNPIKMDDFGGFPPIFGSTPICSVAFRDFPTILRAKQTNGQQAAAIRRLKWRVHPHL